MFSNMFTFVGSQDLTKYFDLMKEKIIKEDRYADTTRMYSERGNADKRAEARSALQGERLAINTRKRRSTWRDVKFRNRQGNKVFDENKTMDVELDKANYFLSKGKHNKTALER